ncbi:type VI secretion system tip protein VgrG [Vibrio sp. JC009]|uniref:type VI secretion system Vgr family protein n=1 Tax=Vibrio sp. JC009 TaxID=2912314 RepID=UPI0023B19D2E|nr:type VI secretion system tip protein TssI/VgrG [Vibrio sp. JC009]WED22954.1 type VI secretion system tip protein VgrG [Vibrio sp. JC009]
MAESLTQINRAVTVTTPLGDDTLVFWKMIAEEGISQLFTYRLELLSEDDSLDFNSLLGEKISVTYQNPDGKTRFFHGHVSDITYAGTISRFPGYQIILKPWLWFLSRSSNCRIFQQKSVPDIIMEVFRNSGFSDFENELSGDYPTVEYCVQYNETDLNFVSRLMESVGIYYFFRHEEDKDRHVMVFCDDIQSNTGNVSLNYLPKANISQREKECIYTWIPKAKVQPGTYSSQDAHFHSPPMKITGRKSDPQLHSLADKEIYELPDSNYLHDDLQLNADIRFEELKAKTISASAEGNSIEISTGSVFYLEDFPRDDQNDEFLITSARYELSTNEYTSTETGKSAEADFHCSFSTIPADVRYRPERVTPKPFVYGPQTALVVTSDSSGEEIDTDEHGRIKVRFFWVKKDNGGQSSCWVRVSQSVAGGNWGSICLPRVGQEVIVEFIGGDPDRPLVTGAVYNSEMKPPYTLPGNKTQTGIKTRSSKSGSGDNFNELRFEDKKDAEEVYLHAERDFTRIVENNDVLTVGFEKSEPGDQEIDIYRNRTTMLETGDDTLALRQGDQSIDIAGKQKIKVMGKVTYESPTSIELKVGASKVKIEPAKVSIESPQIEIKASATLKAEAVSTEIKGSALLKLDGGVIKIN